MPTVEARINLIQKYSSLIIRQVSRLKQSGLNSRQIADDVLIPLSEVEEILEFCEQGKTGMRRGMSNAGV